MAGEKASALDVLPRSLALTDRIVLFGGGIEFSAPLSSVAALLAGAASGGDAGATIISISNADITENTAVGATIGDLSVNDTGTWVFDLPLANSYVSLSGTNSKTVKTGVTAFNFEGAAVNKRVLFRATRSTPVDLDNYKVVWNYVYFNVINDTSDDLLPADVELDLINNTYTSGSAIGNLNSRAGNLVPDGLPTKAPVTHVGLYSMGADGHFTLGAGGRVGNAGGTIGGFATVDLSDGGGGGVDTLPPTDHTFSIGETAVVAIKVGSVPGQDPNVGLQFDLTGAMALHIDSPASQNGAPYSASQSKFMTWVIDATNNAVTYYIKVVATSNAALTVGISTYNAGYFRFYGCDVTLGPAIQPWYATTSAAAVAAGTSLLLSGPIATIATASTGTIVLDTRALIKSYPASLFSRGATTGAEHNIVAARTGLVARVDTSSTDVFPGIWGYSGVGITAIAWNGSGWTAYLNGGKKVTSATPLTAGAVAKLCEGTSGYLRKVRGWTTRVPDSNLAELSKPWNYSLTQLGTGLGSAAPLGTAVPSPNNIWCPDFAGLSALLRRRTLAAGDANYHDSTAFSQLNYAPRIALWSGSQPFIPHVPSEPDARGGTLNDQGELNVDPQAFEDLTGWSSSVNPFSQESDGAFRITARVVSTLPSDVQARMPVRGRFPNGTVSNAGHLDQAYIYFSGTVVTAGYLEGTNGYVEYILRVDRQGRNFPAVWELTGALGGYHATYENDTYEGGFNSSQGPGYVNCSVHANTYSAGQTDIAGLDTGVDQRFDYWSIGTMIDPVGQTVTYFQNGEALNVPRTLVGWNYNQQLESLINLAMGASFIGDPDPAAGTQKLDLLAVRRFSPG